MGKEKPWAPGDGAEQVDPGVPAQQQRLGTSHFTPQHRSDEVPAADGSPVAQPAEAFDPSYAQWREANGNRLDDDYRRWRAETGQPFSEAFLDWAAQEARDRRRHR